MTFGQPSNTALDTIFDFSPYFTIRFCWPCACFYLCYQTIGWWSLDFHDWWCGFKPPTGVLPETDVSSVGWARPSDPRCITKFVADLNLPSRQQTHLLRPSKIASAASTYRPPIKHTPASGKAYNGDHTHAHNPKMREVLVLPTFPAVRVR